MTLGPNQSFDWECIFEASLAFSTISQGVPQKYIFLFYETNTSGHTVINKKKFYQAWFFKNFKLFWQFGSVNVETFFGCKPKLRVRSKKLPACFDKVHIYFRPVHEFKKFETAQLLKNQLLGFSGICREDDITLFWKRRFSGVYPLLSNKLKNIFLHRVSSKYYRAVSVILFWTIPKIHNSSKYFERNFSHVVLDAVGDCYKATSSDVDVTGVSLVIHKWHSDMEMTFMRRQWIGYIEKTV